MARKICATFCTALALVWSFAAMAAFVVDEKLSDPADEQRAGNLFAMLRCTVCQGQDIASSNAELAVSMRKLVRSYVEEGKSDEEIQTFLRQRYGNEIWMEPELNTSNLVLWFAPILLIIAGIIYSFSIKKQRVKEE